jgi:hypothetical protein
MAPNVAPNNVGASFNHMHTGHHPYHGQNQGQAHTPNVGTSNGGSSFNRVPAGSHASQPITQVQSSPVQKVAPHPQIQVQNKTNLPKPPAINPLTNTNSGSSGNLQQTLKNLTAPPSAVPPTISPQTLKNLTAPTTVKAPAVKVVKPPTSAIKAPTPVVVAPAPVRTVVPTPQATKAVTPASVASTQAPAPTPAPQEKITVQMGTSGTQFKMNKVGTDKYTFEVVGSNKGDRFLDGVKQDGSAVGLGIQGGNGTVWKVHEEKGGKVRLECVQCSGSDKYLDGSKSGGPDQLGLAIASNTGTLWKMNKGANGVVTFECADKDSGPKLLSLKGDSASPAPSAPSSTTISSTPTKDNSKSGSTAAAAPTASSQKTTSKTDSSDKTKTSKAEEPSTGVIMGSVGSQFIIHDKGGGLFTIEVVGVDKSAKYVDGSKNDGTVGLGVAGNKGTTWKKETDSSGNVRFKCADCTGSKVYLDGQQSDGAWMVGSGIKGNSGTEWKMVPQPDGRYSLECVDKKSGPQYLSMVSDGKTVTPTVPYEPKKAPTITVVSSPKGSDAKINVSSSTGSDTNKKAPDDKSQSKSPTGQDSVLVVTDNPLRNQSVTINVVDRPTSQDQSVNIVVKSTGGDAKFVIGKVSDPVQSADMERKVVSKLTDIVQSSAVKNADLTVTLGSLMTKDGTTGSNVFLVGGVGLDVLKMIEKAANSSGIEGFKAVLASTLNLADKFLGSLNPEFIILVPPNFNPALPPEMWYAPQKGVGAPS